LPSIHSEAKLKIRIFLVIKFMIEEIAIKLANYQLMAKASFAEFMFRSDNLLDRPLRGLVVSERVIREMDHYATLLRATELNIAQRSFWDRAALREDLYAPDMVKTAQLFERACEALKKRRIGEVLSSEEKCLVREALEKSRKFRGRKG
jgi:hypothetical protein